MPEDKLHNTANMKFSFKVHLPQQHSDDSMSEEENLDDDHLWEGIDAANDTEFPWSSSDHASCFAHSLWLLVNDGMWMLESFHVSKPKRHNSQLCYAAAHYSKTSLGLRLTPIRLFNS